MLLKVDLIKTALTQPLTTFIWKADYNFNSSYLFAPQGICDRVLDSSHPRLPFRFTLSAQHEAPHRGVDAEIPRVLVCIWHGDLRGKEFTPAP